MDLGLRDKVVLATGATRGIGRAVAIAYAPEGAHIALTSASDPTAAAGVVEAIGEAVGFTIAENNLAHFADSVRESVRRRTPSRRLSVPEDVAAAVLLLGSPANGNVSAAYLAVADGID
jgi:NAD(P)-dependent dehydrogenase (short-subunit alcohol dehydrogenase family)